jgi:transcriptional regulator with XRE-family HTH domain
MVLLRRVIGDALRARRQSQHRTLREVSTAANVSLGYLSEIERGQKEPSSELLSAICDALGAAQSEVLRVATETLVLEEQLERSASPAPVSAPVPVSDVVPAPAPVSVSDVVPAATPVPVAEVVPVSVAPVAVVDGDVSVAVRRSGPLKTTLRAKRTATGRSVVRAA